MTVSRSTSAYIVAARRTAVGRIGGMHRNRRIEDLTAPVITAALQDANIDTDKVDEIVIGNASQGGNPARLIALAAGLPDRAPALTVDRQCSSGLDAILHAIRTVDAAEADIIVAGGAESLSTAPWRIAKPRSVYQMPHFIGPETSADVHGDLLQSLEAAEDLARRNSISRQAQDAFALKSHLRAESAEQAKKFVGEIIPLRANRDEARDESAIGPSREDIEDETAFLTPDGTLSPANTSQPHDGAAIVVVVSHEVWQQLGEPPALKLVVNAAQGVSPVNAAEASVSAMQKLYGRLNGFDRSTIIGIEMSETSAAQAIVLANAIGLDEGIINSDGGDIVRGHPLGASSAILVVRLFSRLVRERQDIRSGYGAVVQGAIGGLGLAAMFEAV